MPVGGGGEAHGHHPDGPEVGGEPQQAAQAGDGVGTQETGYQTFVDRRQQQVLQGGSDVHPPVWDGPFPLRQTGQKRVGLVREPVAVHIGGGGDAGDDVRRGPAQPRLVAFFHVAVLPGPAGDFPAQAGVGYHLQPPPPGSPGGGGPFARLGDSPHRPQVHRGVPVAAHHFPPGQNLVEFHPAVRPPAPRPPVPPDPLWRRRTASKCCPGRKGGCRCRRSRGRGSAL